MLFAEPDFSWVKENYPELEIGDLAESVVLAGSFRVCAVYDYEARHYIINPTAGQCENRIFIDDQYAIEVTIPKSTSGQPIIRDTSNRILSAVEKSGSLHADLHVYPDGRICPVGELDLDDVTSLQQLLDTVVLEYFYDQSHFARTGRWPRGQYSHGLIGLLENYIDRVENGNTELDCKCLSRIARSKSDEHYSIIWERLTGPEKIGGHLKCICSDKRTFRTCPSHQKIYRALWRLQRLWRENGMRSKSVV